MHRKKEKALILWRSYAGKSWMPIPSPAGYFNALSIAPDSGEGVRRLRITHPFHPLKDKQFELIEHRCIFGESYLYFYDDSGLLREIPAVWTDFLTADVFVELAGGRSPLHAETLLELADLVERWAKDPAGHV